MYVFWFYVENRPKSVVNSTDVTKRSLAQSSCNGSNKQFVFADEDAIKAMS